VKELVELRNALAHNDESKLLALPRSGVSPTIGYPRAGQAVLGRHAELRRVFGRLHRFQHGQAF